MSSTILVFHYQSEMGVFWRGRTGYVPYFASQYGKVEVFMLSIVHSKVIYKYFLQVYTTQTPYLPMPVLSKSLSQKVVFPTTTTTTTTHRNSPSYLFRSMSLSCISGLIKAKESAGFTIMNLSQFDLLLNLSAELLLPLCCWKDLIPGLYQ